MTGKIQQSPEREKKKQAVDYSVKYKLLHKKTKHPTIKTLVAADATSTTPPAEIKQGCFKVLSRRHRGVLWCSVQGLGGWLKPSQ